MNRGIFFDLDGTLADTLPLLREVYRAFLQAHGKSDSDSEFAEINGPPLDRVVQLLQSRYQLSESPATLLAHYQGIMRERYLDALPSEGALEVVTHARSRGWVCAVVTSNSESLAREWLSRYGLLEAMSVVVGKESVRIGKPDPEPYLLATQKTDCDPRVSIAVEDSPAGLHSARAANLWTFAYRPGGDHVGSGDPNVLTALTQLKPWLDGA